MREFIEEAARHRDDGRGRAQAADRPTLPKKFYAVAAVAEDEGGYYVTLDGRAVGTPTHKAIRVPSRELAEAMVREWDRQADVIDPRVMPLVRLVNSAVELGEDQLPALRDEIAKYAANDLLLYRADTPHELVEEQERRWDPVLVALARRFGVMFQPTVGIIHLGQPPHTLEKLRASLEGEGLLALAALNSMTTLTGSGLLALAYRQGLVDADAAWTAAHVDEDHNIRLWGEDEEAAKRRHYRRREFDAAAEILRAVGTPDAPR
jgi:chaperone required for assembly of F1-ATPase